MPDLTADLIASPDGCAAGVDAGPCFGYAGAELEALADVPARRLELARAQVLDSRLFVLEDGATRADPAP